MQKPGVTPLVQNATPHDNKFYITKTRGKLMNDTKSSDQEPEVKEADKDKVIEAPKERRAFTKVRRELSEEELSSPAAHRLLLDDLDRLEQQVVELSEFRERFHKTDKDKAVLKERIRTSIAFEIISCVCLTIGAALIGLTPFLWNTKPLGHFSLLVGGILIICSIIAKAVKK